MYAKMANFDILCKANPSLGQQVYPSTNASFEAASTNANHTPQRLRLMSCQARDLTSDSVQSSGVFAGRPVNSILSRRKA